MFVCVRVCAWGVFVCCVCVMCVCCVCGDRCLCVCLFCMCVLFVWWMCVFGVYMGVGVWCLLCECVSVRCGCVWGLCVVYVSV